MRLIKNAVYVVDTYGKMVDGSFVMIREREIVRCTKAWHDDEYGWRAEGYLEDDPATTVWFGEFNVVVR